MQQCLPVAPRTTFASHSLGRFLALVKASGQPSLWELGPAAPHLQLFLEQGLKVYVEDLRVPGVGGEASDPLGASPPAWSPPPPGPLGGILCWNLFDALEPAQARRFIRVCSSSLVPGGAIHVLFAGPQSRIQYGAFRIVHDQEVEAVAADPMEPPRTVYENLEIVRLFASFRVLSAHLLRNGFREVLAQKPRRP